MRALIWHATVLFAMLVIPGAAVFGDMYWQVNGQNGWILLALGTTYATAVGVAASAPHRSLSRLKMVAGALALATGLLTIVFALVLLPEIDFSRAHLALATFFLIAGFIGYMLALAEWVGYPLAWTGFALTVVIVGVGYANFHGSLAVKQEFRREARIISASQHILTAVTYSGYLPRPSGQPATGGAVTADPKSGGYVLARASGEIYRLSWMPGGDLDVSDTGLRVPLNAAAFAADVAGDVDKSSFRVADIVARNEGEGTRIFVSHHYWKRDRKCFVARVSTLVLPAPSRGRVADHMPWQSIFETEPCLPVGASRGTAFAGKQIGGNLELFGDDKLLLTVGDHQFDGWYRPVNYVQDPRAHYGKTILISLRSGAATIFTTGHRNPQGLTVGSDGRIWSTEHGPQGGDELNLLRQGANYGYPTFTHGTEYGSTIWPPAEGARPDPSLSWPIFSWVPSIAPTDLVEITDPAFHRWKGDLLIATLRHAIWRVRVDGVRVIYAEPIHLGKRIRDIAVGKGEFVLLTDAGDIMRISPNESVAKGAALFTLHCGGCHDDMEHRIGPYLKGVLGRKTASAKGYEYSHAMKRAGWKWTEARLDAFLSDPQAYLPGTSMVTDGVRDAEVRKRILAYIRYFY
jgi:aldose sugar dehydrogenase